MWDSQCQSWRLMFAMVPQSKDTPPTFYHVTWKQDQYGKWKTLSSPPYTALMKDLHQRDPMTVHIQLHSSDFAKLPLSGAIKWLIEFPPAWSWFLSWSPLSRHCSRAFQVSLLVGISFSHIYSDKRPSLVFGVSEHDQLDDARIISGVPDASPGL